LALFDPARRLADSLGLKEFDADVQRVPLENLEIPEVHSSQKSDLYAMMLDAKRTFDQLIARYASPEFQKNILNNRYYHHLSSNMAGSHEYMAMEKLYEVFDQHQYDLIVLDTPPSRRALDFLEAPQRMMNILGHNFFMNMFKPYLRAGKWGIRFLNIFASPVLRGLSKVLGKQVMEDFAGFMHLWDDIMFEGFSRRASEVKVLLSSNETLFLAVATPQRLPMNEAVFLYNKLISNQMPFGGFVINRVNLPASHNDKQKLDASNLFNGTIISAGLKKKLITIYQNVEKMSQSDARSVRNLKDTIGSEESVLQIPCAEGNIANLDDLYQLSRQLERTETI